MESAVSVESHKFNISYSKRKRTSDQRVDDYFFPDDYCQEVWTTNVKLYNKKEDNDNKNKKHRLYIVELHCYNGYAMIKFYPKMLKRSRDKYRMRSSEFGSNLSVGEIRKLLGFCGQIMNDYLNKFSENYIGFVGQIDSTDNCVLKNRMNSQRFKIYTVYINTYFKRPKFSILDNTFNIFNIKLIRRCVHKKGGTKQTSAQKVNYKNFLDHFRGFDKQAIVSFMTKAQLKAYIANQN